MPTIQASAAAQSERDTRRSGCPAVNDRAERFPQRQAATTRPYVMYMANVQSARITTSACAQNVKTAVIGIATQIALTGTLCSLTFERKREAGSFPSRAIAQIRRVRVVRLASTQAKIATDTHSNAVATTYLGK